MNNVARIDLSQSDSPVEWSCDVAVNDLQLRVVDLCLIGAHGALKLVRQRLLGVDLLLRDAPRRNQSCISVQVQLRVTQLGLVTKELGLHLLELHLVWTRVNLDQQFARSDILSLADIYLHDLPVDAALDVGGVERGHRSQAR